MLIDSGKVVHLGLTVLDDTQEGLQIDTSKLDVMVGFGQLLPKVEQALIGLQVGGQCAVKLQPAEAFGEYDELKVVQFDKDDFPSDVQAGDLFEVENERSEVAHLKVLQVHEDHVLVDLNHDLAGKCVTIKFEVLAIRPANGRELAAARKRQANADVQRAEGLLPVNALLQGRTRR
jgi:FKBP-type peptidyl-prolyl cis-trans isomerase SlyD